MAEPQWHHPNLYSLKHAPHFKYITIIFLLKLPIHLDCNFEHFVSILSSGAFSLLIRVGHLAVIRLLYNEHTSYEHMYGTFAIRKVLSNL